MLLWTLLYVLTLIVVDAAVCYSMLLLLTRLCCSIVVDVAGVRGNGAGAEVVKEYEGGHQ